MENKVTVQTVNAPAAIGPYSQAVRVGHTVYLSGQIPLDPHSMTLVDGDIRDQAQQVFDNLLAVAKAAGGDLTDIVKLTVFLTDLSHFPAVNEVMVGYFNEPYPARACVGVTRLPMNAQIEVDAILVLAS